ncbi:MAG: response regulator [Rhodospirillaceae bacterium]|jgi:CheY-like chemotaxis protein|nr:response regulator [Rhodospirillaceae bacterium]MBT4771055.1 response regulator [Rhodospirillaceae bacterium]MBT5357680.1 response regulator [Rhodospirillaceae bacterium]MBT5768888.1 response regulator [Rhodospirillaceae bacterium]MBT6308940.1 response regulator [Rhodospirillaceae bacterium]
MALLHEHNPTDASRRRAVLIVDDEELQRNQLVDCLSDLDVVIFQAGNGAEALEIIDDQVPSLIIMDIRMPVMDGVTTVDELSNRGGEMKIILMTGDPMSLEAAYKRRPNVFTIIEKPLPLRVLRRFVIEALGLAA